MGADDRRYPTWTRVQQVFEFNGFPPPRIAIETTSLALRLPLIAKSDLLSYSSMPVVRRAAPHLRFAEFRVKELEYTRRVGVMYRKNSYLSPIARRFIAILKETAYEITKNS